MATNRFLVTLLLLSCFYATIFGLRWSIRRKRPTVSVSPDCRDKHSSCSRYSSNGYCNFRAHETWMRKNCAKTCGVCTIVRPTTKSCSDKYIARVCSRFSSNGNCFMPGNRRWMKEHCPRSCGFCGSKWFQIHSSTYGKCLTVIHWSQLSLRDCVEGSLEQNWRWTTGGRLQVAFRRRYLEVTSIISYKGRTYGVSLQPYIPRRRSQKWTCTASGYLKSKNDNLYLVPVRSRRQGRVINSVSVRNAVTNSGRWSRYGTKKSLCDDGKASTTSNPITTQMATPTTAVMPTTKTDPPTRTTLPPVSTTGDLGMPSQWFQIHASAYKKCLTASIVKRRVFAITVTTVSLSLRDCVRNSAGQKWRWTRNERLQSALNQQCLSVTRITRSRGSIYGSSLQRCNSRTSYQQWTCTGGGYLKLKGINRYLIPVLRRGRVRGSVQVRNRVTNSCLWSRYGTTNSLCTDEVPKTTVLTTQMTTIGSENPWFQIKNAAFNKCVALRDKSTLANHYRTSAPLLTLETCEKTSSRQLWQWTSNDHLRLSYNGKCLVSNVYNSPRFVPCDTVGRNKGWSCEENKLKWGNIGLYLRAWMYSGLPFGYNVITKWGSCRTNACDWNRAGTGVAVCDNGKPTSTRPLTTAQVTTPATTRPPTTTRPPATTRPPTTTTNLPTTTTAPPVPPTDGLGTPPLPPTDSLNTPPIPRNTPPVPPFPGNTPPVPPFPGNTPPVQPFPGNTPPVPPPVITTPKPTPPPGNRNVMCGTKGRTGGVVNGTAAAAGSWPWMVGIKKCARCNISCGGTLINDEWVVTAAHCVTASFPDELHLVVGEVDQSRRSGHEQHFKGRVILVHEDYAVDAPYDKDIALIRLDKYAVFNDHVRPLCLPEQGKVLTDKDLCTVTGFGRITEFGAKSAKLLQANVKITALQTCVKSYVNLPRPRKVTTNMLCAGYERGGTDACQGDSGGPLTCLDRSKFRFILGGVVSWGIGCARPNLFGVYTNTALFTPWIEKKLAAYGD